MIKKWAWKVNIIGHNWNKLGSILKKYYWHCADYTSVDTTVYNFIFSHTVYSDKFQALVGGYVGREVERDAMPRRMACGCEPERVPEC